MTTEINKKPLWRRLAVPVLGGAVAGFLAATGFLSLVDIGKGSDLGTSREIAGLAGMLYATTGLAVLFGVASPGVGAKFLHVEDADELREQRKMLSYSGVAMTLLGGALVLLALTGEDAFVPASIGAIGAISMIAVSVILSVIMRRYTDELHLALSNDAVVTAFYILLLVGGGWSIFAHLKYVTGPAPLDWLTMFAASLLVGTFWQTARRGLMLRGPN